ncbi:hypothetical protein OH77DRAFT_1524672 [Trametes cingulata]|nr:hypothetical protein OH77DRAFT_1524672 [Trametes cingulata]
MWIDAFLTGAESYKLGVLAINVQVHLAWKKPKSPGYGPWCKTWLALDPHTIDFTLHDQPDQEDFKNDVISQVYSMLRAWLAFPDSANSISHIQGTFIRHILSVFGTGHVLYLEKMWQFFTTA